MVALKENISFSPPDITDLEIKNVIEVLKSGWITTGPKTKEFERRIAEYCGTKKVNCLNSATACMELCLRMLGIGPGDEVITSAYTYTASASVINHVGAKIVLVDTDKDSYHLSYSELEKAISPKTKAIIPVDIAGVMCDYDKIFDIVERKRNLFTANNDIQALFDRVIILADAAHSFGASYEGHVSGNVADFTSFSFHAVKNLTTAEGGALTWKSLGRKWDEKIYKTVNNLSLHGQTKDALSKMQLGSWEYDIVSPAYKCNMTDINAAIGLIQLDRYSNFVNRRTELVDFYKKNLSVNSSIDILDHKNSSMHLMLIRINSLKSIQERNNLVVKLSEKGIATNVHYKPLPLLTAYKNLGFDIHDFPNANYMYEKEITLPLHTKLSNEDVEYITKILLSLV